MKELQISGADTTSRRYLKPELVQMCKDRNIPTDITNPVVIPGWLNKPKGMSQILYERGYINKELVTKPSRMRYSKNGKKNDYEHDKRTLKSTCEQYSLTHLLSKCTDFKEEKTDIDQMCEELSSKYDYSVNILFTPKFHCELAGEGIEYSWGASKRLYRREPLHKKRQSGEFKRLVHECVSKVNINMVRRFSQKARNYMLTYLHLRAVKNNTRKDALEEWNFVKNEKLHKVYSSHRDANCIKGKYIEAVMCESIGCKKTM